MAVSSQEMVTLSIDGKSLSVPRGTNIIEAAKSIGISIPHFCFHKNLSISGNCRMCQVKVKGSANLEIACNLGAREGMEVQTHRTSKEVSEAQAAILEFMLINHPLDCTVCDQAGDCKLQNYYRKYSNQDSRFSEEKEHKIKAQPLGPTVILDAERCIQCTRCIRFCDEITKTHELGMINRGDASLVAIKQGRELNNPLSGTVVDLCPVGALTHRLWRFNSRIWFAKEIGTICPGCSRGCNVRVFVNDKQIVRIKAQPNAAVNQNWLCDEGRYGFDRFLPQKRQTKIIADASEISFAQAVARLAQAFEEETLIFLAPDLLTEEYWLLKKILDGVQTKHKVVMSYRRRALSEVEAILLSADYAANFRAAEYAGLIYGDYEAAYEAALDELRGASCKNALFVGERALAAVDIDQPLIEGLRQLNFSAAMLADAESKLARLCNLVLPGQSILEKSGLLINCDKRLQYASKVIDSPEGSYAEWQVLLALGERLGLSPVFAKTDRDLSSEFLAEERRLNGLSIALIKAAGVQLG